MKKEREREAKVEVKGTFPRGILLKMSENISL
jgi:hypothetical protein